MKILSNTADREEILERSCSVKSEVLPESLPLRGDIEGCTSEVNTHLNAGGVVRIGTPTETYSYFTARFSQLVAQ